MDTLLIHHQPEANAESPISKLGGLPEQRYSLVDLSLDPLTSDERLLADLDDEALDQLANEMASRGISA